MELKTKMPEDVAKYIPECLSVQSTISMLLYSFNKMQKDATRLREAYDIMNRDYATYTRRVRSNNWLKMNGYPMRRKRSLHSR